MGVEAPSREEQLLRQLRGPNYDISFSALANLLKGANTGTLEALRLLLDGFRNDLAPSSVANGTLVHSLTALNATKQEVKGTAGNLYGVHFYNPNTAPTYIQCFNLAAASVTVGTTTPTFVLVVPGHTITSADGTPATVVSTVPGLLDRDFAAPYTFGTGFTIAATTTPTGSTNPANTLISTLFYN